MVVQLVRLVAGLLLILANGFFVAIEFALTRVRQYPAEEFDRPDLRKAWEMTEDLEIYLTSCQVGITASSIALGVIAEPALAALFEPLFEGTVLPSVAAGGILAFLVINLLHLTHGEQTPTYLGVERTKFVCRYGAAPLRAFTWLIRPVIEVGDLVAKATLRLFGVEMTGAWLETGTEVIRSRAELRNRLDSLLHRGELSDERRQEILNALAVGDIPVREIMVPRDEIVALSTTDDAETVLAVLRDHPYTRFPVVDGDLDEPVGVVYAPSVLGREEELRDGSLVLADVASPTLTVDADRPVSDVIDTLQDEAQELALVLEDGEVVGLVTATDLLESIVGQLRDPLDPEE